MFSRNAWRLPVVVLVSIALLGLAACGDDDDSGSDKASLTIGSKLDVDGQLNAQMYALLLEAKGYDVSTKLGLGQTPVLDQAIKSGDIDIYPEFTGTALTTLNLEPTQDAQQAYEQVKAAYEEQFELTMLEPAYELNDSYAICTSQDVAAEHGLQSLDDLAPVAGDLKIAAQQDGIDAAINPVQTAYGFEFGEVVQLSAQLSFDAVKGGDVDLNVCYTTDPAIVVNDFVVLEDTKNVFPIYNPAPLVRDDVLKESPDIAETLNALQPHLTTEVILDLIKQVSVDHESVGDVARAFLEQMGLIEK
ncbi:MAG TPA: glycine betaine ABC transporter substrate-binding protein [Thermomicrobiales bacterium]|nr:glycine betaine ABC transporter substrate-binding protein [Thermomicrobiales bacterium]